MEINDLFDETTEKKRNKNNGISITHYCEVKRQSNYDSQDKPYAYALYSVC